MATSDTLPDSADRQAHRRRHFSTWVRKLANFKSSSDGERPRRQVKKNRGHKNNNPYPESGTVSANHGTENTTEDTTVSFTTARTHSHASIVSPACASADHLQPQAIGGRSFAGTVSTEHDGSTAPDSHGTGSVAGTSRTVGGIDSRRGDDSTFSSPAPSVRSLTTTLTTIQSMATNNNQHTSSTHNNTQSVQFNQPFPTTSPASAIPSHLAPSGPNTYTAATANGLLTDNASILTLASSSKRRRRRSMDTDASVRALAPSSVWGGSRESLPLSVLSANINSSDLPPTPGVVHGSSSRIGADRNSIYSSTGVPPALPSDRNSYYAKQGDAGSVRSGRPGHGRTDSVGTPGLNGPVTSPLASLPDDKTIETNGAPVAPKNQD